ncbi:predicted SnoaL-like aldol condensation-catalyzing enzyme [Streptomyces sp. TLI_55]|uniref:nuclear transport factor 2 family protein n=1 Tax=Streptomyces sp. TLI_55 TaxID=1938861 RepID=UPI000BCA9ED5|nr:nuclear transport factor 2 family protein [Streptomyces sp. TLI_55]SNX62037.1 predicted SnoaL-like aldol condensation-catalyzing enzyme [Streptomyces sp. TLI_55]
MPPTTSVRRALVAFVASTAVLGAAAVPAVAAPHAASAGHAGYGVPGESARLGYQKDVAARVLKGVFERGDTAVVDRFVRPDYIQHNPLAPDGAETLKGLAVSVHQQFPDAKYDIKRVISEGDLVLVHSNVVLTPGARGSAVFDIFRFQGGKIAEHWDVGQNVPESSVNGNDMFSTVSWPQTSEPGPGFLTAYNKKLVTAAFDQLLVKRDLSAIDRYWGPEYDQHNPNIPNGVEGAKAGLGAYFKQFPQLKVTPKRVIAEGDLVAVHSHYVPAPGERGQAIVDLFRVRGGKIVEHWDVIQDVPESSANDNGMF